MSEKKDKEYYLRIYEEEMEANLNLYISGKDDYAYKRYEQLKQYVEQLRSQ